TTLDSTTSSVYIEDGVKVIISDTVGFIKDLPHQLVASFRATLSVVREADLLIILTDLSDPDWDEKLESVRNVLQEISVDQKPSIVVFNKIDRVFEPMEIERAKRVDPDALFISALKGEGIGDVKGMLKNHTMKGVKDEEKERPQLSRSPLYR
ncbi:MAG TPA: GTPase HflX, partial [bacterium (Candidatus Stahlbacteria)]|nr:GTPase HflX [Candidatus Stahlbacteria bacterium]